MILKEEILYEIINEIPAVVFLYHEKVVFINKYFEELTGYKIEEAKDKYIWDFCPEDYKNEVKERVLKRIKGEFLETVEEVNPFKKKDGSLIYLKCISKTLKIDNEYYGLSLAVDITRQVELENDLKKTLDELYTLIRYSPDIIVKIDKNGIIKFKSPAVGKLGYKVNEVLEKNILDYIHPDDRENFKSILEFAFKNKGKTYTVEYRVLNAKGKYIWLEGNLVVPENQDDAYLIERDITDKKEIEIKLQRYIYYDPITGLPNKILFIENLKGILYKRKNKVFVAVFKILNLNELFLIYGEEKVLKSIVNVIKFAFSDFIIARSLTNEFLIGGEMENIFRLYSKLNHLRQILKNSNFFIEYNIGVSITNDIPETPEDLINKAYVALYNSIREGKNKISFYKAYFEKKVKREMKIIELLPEAIKDKELVVFYQPIYKLQGRKCVGFETLLRWFSKELGYVSPSEFIPLAEYTGLILNITEFVLNNTVQDMLTLGGNYFVAVNFSAEEFESSKFIKNILKTLREYNFPYDKFVVEITERLAMKNPERTKYILASLREKGVKIAIDDFGTGYSSMKYLTEFNIDKIKIDHEFVIKMVEDSKSEAIVSTIISLAHSLNATALAEGIENKEILNKLLNLNCDEGQGFYFAKPVPFNEIKRVIQKNEQ